MRARRGLALSVYAVSAFAAQGPAFGRALSPSETQELREALIYSGSQRSRSYDQMTKAAQCMIGRLSNGFDEPQFRWVIKYYRMELTQSQIDKDPYHLLDWLSDNAAACLAATKGPSRIKFVSASANDKRLVRTTKGSAFVDEAGPFPAELLVARIELGSGNDYSPALAAVQMGACSAHACEIVILKHAYPRWVQVASFNSWGGAYLVDQGERDMKDIVYFDHVTSDCMACSPPQPVRLTWNEERQRYVKNGVVSSKEAGLYKLTRIKDPRGE